MMATMMVTARPPPKDDGDEGHDNNAANAMAKSNSECHGNGDGVSRTMTKTGMVMPLP